MKKIISLFLSIFFISAISVSVFSAGNGTVTCKAADTVKRAEVLTVTYSLKDVAAFKSIAVTPQYDKAIFDYVSAEWLLEGTMLDNYDVAKGNGAAAFGSEQVVNGDIFKLVLKVKDAANVGNTDISVKTVIKNGGTDIPVDIVSKTIKIACKDHTYGAWSVTKTATCEVAGSEKRICSTCSEYETRAINAFGHKMSAWEQSKASTCETKGEQKRTCTSEGCNYSETKAVSEIGHKFSNPTVTKKPTCTETGLESGKCIRCNKTTTNTLKATGHTYGLAIVTKKATEKEEGLKTQTCTTCGDVKEDIIPVISEQPDISTEDAEQEQNQNITIDANDEIQDNDTTTFLIIIIIGTLILGVIVIILLIKKKKYKY